MLRSLLLCVFAVGCLDVIGAVPKVRPLPPDSRIVGGTEVDISQHPYQLSLQTTGHICGASVISRDWAVTAGHCVGSATSRYSLHAGNTNRDRGTRYSVKRIVRHPNYNPRTIDYDVAVIQINGTFNFSSTISPISLATKELPNKAMVNVTGWGALREGGAASPWLMRVSLPIVSRIQCQKVYKYLNTITTRMICAGYTAGGKDSCQGDSGGPLVAGNVQYGIVSWGYGCAQPQYPGVYTNVADVRSWIKNVTKV